MRSTLNAPASRIRRSVLILVFAATLVAVPVGMRAAETPQTPAMAFKADAGMVFYQIKPSGTKDFEEVMAKVREALAKSEDPTRQKQAQSWRIFKAAEPMAGNTLYIFFMDPAVQGADYDFVKMLGEGFKDDPKMVQDLYAKLKGAFAGGGNLLNLSLVQRMGGM
jgi:hypothetical protein